MEITYDDLLSVLEQLDVFIGITGFIFGAVMWYRSYRKDQMIKDRAAQIKPIADWDERVALNESTVTAHPAILAVSLVPDTYTIINDVRLFLKQKGEPFSGITVREEILMNGINGKADRAELLLKYRRTKATLDAMGVTGLHVFYQGPGAGAALLGAIFNNWKPTKIYHKNHQTGQYEYWFNLDKF